VKEDFTGEPYLLSLGVLTRGGGVLCEPTSPALETFNPSEWFVIALYKYLRIYFNRNLLGDLVKKPIGREKKYPLKTMYKKKLFN